MKKDPTEFRQRFAQWKNGEKPYDSGLPKYENGKDQFEDTIDFLRQHEGFKDTTYLDGNGIPTIGYGFTDSQLVKKGKINRNDADIRLRKEVEDRELFLSGIKNWDKLSEASKTALRSYYYNYPAGFKDTTKFMKAWNSGDYEEAIRQVDAGMNDPANPGLRRRRMQEQQLLMSDPFLTTKRSKFVKQLEDSPVYTGQFKYIKPIQTDYSLTNRSGGKLNAWKGAGSPSYGGVDIRIPDVEEYMTNMNVFNPYKNKKSILPISF